MTTFYDPDLLDEAPGIVVREARNRHGKALLYPPMGFDLTQPPEAFTVNANEVARFQIELGVSAKTVVQPQPIKRIADVMLVPDSSVYVITGQDTLPVSPKAWRQYGGRITVKINPDTVTATVTIRGASLPFLSPFTIGWDDGGTTFGGLFLVGTGVGIWKRTISIDTGLTGDDVADDTSAAIDNPFMQSREQAWDAAHGALVRRLGNFQRATLSLTGVDGIDGVDAQRPESALGRLAGARVWFDGGYYRVRSASISATGIEATCEQDTTFGDHAAAFPTGCSFDAFDALHAGQRFRDFDADPLAGGVLDG